MTRSRPFGAFVDAADRPLHVVLFTGGRGASALTERLLAEPRISLTLAINGYDDGASTGEVRRFLGDSLGPSDFRKNASRVARALRTAPAELVELLDLRLPDEAAVEQLSEVAAAWRRLPRSAGSPAPAPLVWPAASALAHRLELPTRAALAGALEEVDVERRRTGRALSLADCAVGNLVFAGLFLRAGRRFNDAVDAYDRLLGIPAGLIENVTDGANAFLVAIDHLGRLLASEADIVDARQRNCVQEIALVGAAVGPAEVAEAATLTPLAMRAWLAARSREVRLNPRLVERLAMADLIVYAPGTQHSSLFPSYLTVGLGDALAANVRAVKLLVTNLHADAEIHDRSAVDLAERALYYLRPAGRDIPAPCLITHCLINRPGAVPRPAFRHRPPAGATGPSTPYVAPGALDRVEDPRMVWVSNFEAGASGRHDAGKVLDPFLSALLGPQRRPRVALLLQGSRASSHVAQTTLEMTRGGAGDAPVDLVAFHTADGPALAELARRLPFRLEALPPETSEAGFAAAAAAIDADYVGLLDSSGMYHGEDVVALLAQLPIGRPAAVWGSRRLSVRDVHESYRVRYRHRLLLGAASYAGSHLLSLMYLAIYGRYVSDTLSEARIVRREYLSACRLPIGHRQINHALLAAVLGDRAELRELPVRFLPLSPANARRTGIGDGLAALTTILRLRLHRTARALRQRVTARRRAKAAAPLPADLPGRST